jgi:hypothetical protein
MQHIQSSKRSWLWIDEARAHDGAYSKKPLREKGLES